MKNPTRHKLREARYFLDEMKSSFHDDDRFYWNLSAFLSAARSITLFMQKQYSRQTGFSDWYCRKQVEMKADEELEYLNHARVEAVHTEPVMIGATRQNVLTAAAVIARSEPEEKRQPEQTEAKPAADSTPETVRRFFPKFGNVEVVPFCEKQLDKLSGLVEDCETSFLHRSPSH